MKPLTLHPHEIIRLLSTGSVTVWRPMKPQPPTDAREVFEWFADEGLPKDRLAPQGCWYRKQNGTPEFVCAAPHPPGSERWVKERFGWAVTPKGKSVIVYQADNQARPVLCDNEGEGDCVGIGKKPVEYVAVDGVLWKAAQRMPRWASRLSVVSKAVQARQVESVTEKEAVEAGMCHGGPMLNYLDFSSWWQSRYGKPCKTCKGDGAVTAWSGSSSGNDVQLDTEVCPDCNGEPMPLEWDANPWAWATTLERKA